MKAFSQPFFGKVSRETLLGKIDISDVRPEAIPLWNCYYVDDWGFCVTKAQRDSLTDGEYQVNIDDEHRDGRLTIGEAFLPGNSDREVLLTSYLCHPKGANDNFSGVVVAVELFRMLSRLSDRKYSYRLLLNPETISSLAWEKGGQFWRFQ